jgi:hypothetical protein
MNRRSFFKRLGKGAAVAVVAPAAIAEAITYCKPVPSTLVLPDALWGRDIAKKIFKEYPKHTIIDLLDTYKNGKQDKFQWHEQFRGE